MSDKTELESFDWGDFDLGETIPVSQGEITVKDETPVVGVKIEEVNPLEAEVLVEPPTVKPTAVEIQEQQAVVVEAETTAKIDVVQIQTNHDAQLQLKAAEYERMKLEVQLEQEKEKRKIDEERAELKLKSLELERSLAKTAESNNLEVESQIAIEKERMAFERDRFEKEIKLKELELELVKQKHEFALLQTRSNRGQAVEDRAVVEPKTDIILEEPAYTIKNHESEFDDGLKRFDSSNEMVQRLFESRYEAVSAL